MKTAKEMREITAVGLAKVRELLASAVSDRVDAIMAQAEGVAKMGRYSVCVKVGCPDDVVHVDEFKAAVEQSLQRWGYNVVRLPGPDFSAWPTDRHNMWEVSW